jgi:hypothetical protein
MAINKNFVVKHGLEVDNNLIFANAEDNKVGIGTTNNLQYILNVEGDVGISSGLHVPDTAFINDLNLSGKIITGEDSGLAGAFLISTGVGVTWKKYVRNSNIVYAFPGQTTFYDLDFLPNNVEVYINGVKLNSSEFNDDTGNQIILNEPCFGGEVVEIITNDVLPISGIGITVQKNNVTVANDVNIFNFVGNGVTVTSASANKVNITIEPIDNPPGKTVYVAMNGDDSKDGLSLNAAKKTIKNAVGITSSGDTVKVSPGTYIEDNPITLPENVSIEGAELRNCIVTPLNPGSDLFWVTNGTHLTDLSFQGQSATNGAAVVAFKPLVGVASDRFFDAARMIRYNLDFIASEAVGYLTSTDYKSPALVLSAGVSTVTSGIKTAFRAVCHDITRGGNSKCVGVGITHYTQYVGFSSEIIDVLNYSAGIAKSCINNVLWTGNYQSEFTQVRDLSMQPDGAYGNQSIDGCANVVSAIYSCVGVVTTIIDVGFNASGITTNYPGNDGAFNSGILDPSSSPSQGVGNVTKGPYVRNCTNFIPNSIGMKADGFNADPGDKDDMGITGMMSVDSYTQYNQGGIGVSITNGAYTQLVSIFTICDDIAIYTGSGGQCDITNSNSSFGTKGLVSEGVSDATTLSSYHYTGEVSQNASEGDVSFVISGIGNQRPYSGQALYFGELYYEIESVTITNGGSGYTEAPTITFATPTGPSEIIAEAFTDISNGSVVAVNMIGNGRNYRSIDNIGIVTFSAPQSGINTATGVANFRPVYYQVRSATAPSGGISTVTLAQSLNNEVGIGTTVFLSRQSLQIVSSHSFEYIGAGNTIEFARPSTGGVTIQANEVIKINGGEVVYTSTDQDGNFAIGEDLIIDQATGTIRGRAFERSLLNTVTPFIIALGAK